MTMFEKVGKGGVVKKGISWLSSTNLLSGRKQKSLQGEQKVRKRGGTFFNH
jgi:hypothetical protein